MAEFTHTPAVPASPTPGGRSAVADGAPASGSVGSNTAPSGLEATTALASMEEYDSDDNYRWDGDEIGVVFSASSMTPKSNNNFTLYIPSCNPAVLVNSLPSMASLTITPSASLASARGVTVSKHLTSMIQHMSVSSSPAV